MNIRERRFNRIVNQILREELQKGNLPSSKEFIWKVNQYLQSHDISKPSFVLNRARKGTTARASDYNKTMNSVYDDLSMLYKSVVDEHNSAIKNFNKFDVEKAKLDYELNNLENELKEMILLYGKDGYLQSVYDMFNDFTSVDTSSTTAHVDITAHEVTIPNLKNTSKKILPTSIATFDPLADIVAVIDRKVISGSPASALSGSVNQTWQEMMLTATKMNVGGYFTVDFQSIQSLNKISLSLQSTKPTFVKIDFTTDNINWIPLPYYETGVKIQGQYAFDFPSLNASKVRVMMAKTEPDGETTVQGTQATIAAITQTNWAQVTNSISDLDPVSRRYADQVSAAVAQSLQLSASTQMKYEYIFGIKNISFFTNSYSDTADLFSMPLDASSDTNFTIDKVSLLVSEEIPNGTDIEYFVAIPPEGTNPIEWKAISPVNRTQPMFDQIIDFKNVAVSTPTLFFIDPSISIGEYELENILTNGIHFYKIGEIADRQIIDGSEKLFIGKNTWGMQSYVYSQGAGHLPVIDDWKTPQNQVSLDYNQIQDGKPGLIMSKVSTSTPTNYMFTLGVFSKNDKQLVRAIPASVDPIAVYMNGSLIYQGTPDSSTNVNYLFQTGWNEIVVLIYTSASAGTVNGATVDLGFDPRKYGSSVYAKAQPLTKVTLFDLRYNVLNTDNTKYALNVVNNKTQVILNNAVPGLQYEFYYNYIDGTAKDTILFKASLHRDDSITDVSPKLKSYRLRFS